MTAAKVDRLIDELVAEAAPVTPLASPGHRAFAWLGTIALIGAVAIYAFADLRSLLDRYAGREGQMVLEMSAMLATGVIAIAAAFFLSIPGAARRWLAAPLPPFAAWLILSGMGCYAHLVERGAGGLEVGESGECLLFILTTSALLAAPLVWRLSRARPINPLPVALLGGLGIAALSAFALAFFHPFTVTFLDLAMHLAAILIVVAVMGTLNRRTLASS